jgi:uncharacterized DUF497 family protein
VTPRGRHFEFEWDDVKALANVGKHGISFELATTVFSDSALLTVADIEHSKNEERWFSIGVASNGALIAVAYLWEERSPEMVRIRLISARRATNTEIRYYQEGS